MLTDLFWKKIKLEMRLIHIVERPPSLKVKLEPLSEDDFNVSKQLIKQWSENNLQLYSEILQNGMAEFICNRQYIYSFYRDLKFSNKGLIEIDSATTLFSRLRKLDISRNNIKSIKNLPQNCKQLYLDFNPISQIEIKKDLKLQLLSISHSCIDDSLITVLTNKFPQIRCLNISHNYISKLKEFVTCISGLHYLKILVSFHNPISILPIYYSYVTDHINLAYFDGSKYIKEELPKLQEKPIVSEKKEIKQDKKDNKKDNKKGAKIQEKIAEQPPEVKEPPKQIKKQLTASDFEKVKVLAKISNIEQFSGNIFDSSLFPPNTDSLKNQTCFWIKYSFMEQTVELKDQLISFDNATIENDENRLNLQCSINRQLLLNCDNYRRFDQGLTICVMKRQPKMIKDSQTFELKPQISEGQIQMIQEVLGATHIDFRIFHTLKEKKISYKFRLFPIEAAESPLFRDSFQNQKQLIDQKKKEFQEKLKLLEEQKIKRAQQEEQTLLQKKGGKDQKKAADKKAGKKQGKDLSSEKPKTQICNYPIFERLYAVLDEDKMFKGKQLLCIQIKLE